MEYSSSKTFATQIDVCAALFKTLNNSYTEMGIEETKITIIERAFIAISK